LPDCQSREQRGCQRQPDDVLKSVALPRICPAHFAHVHFARPSEAFGEPEISLPRERDRRQSVGSSRISNYLYIVMKMQKPNPEARTMYFSGNLC
jgi:hypothetical protein